MESKSLPTVVRTTKGGLWIGLRTTPSSVFVYINIGRMDRGQVGKMGGGGIGNKGEVHRETGYRGGVRLKDRWKN